MSSTSAPDAADRQRRSNRLAFEVMVPLVALLGFGISLTVRLLGPGIHRWHEVTFLVDYASHGFVRRGLLGTVLAPWLSTPDDVELVLVATAVCSAAVVAWLLVRLGRGLETDQERNALVLAAALLFSQFGFVAGHQDAVVVAALVGAALLLQRERAIPAVVVLVIGGLVHEVTLLFACVLLVAAARAGLLARRTLVVAATSVVAAGLALLTLGRFEGSHEQFVARLPAGTQTDFGSLLRRTEPWTGSPLEGFEDVAHYLTTSPGLIAGGLLLLLVVESSRLLAKRELGLLAAVLPLPTLAIASVAIDHNRWFVLHATTLLLLLVLTGRSVPEVSREWVLPLVVLLLVVGPWGVAVPLPRWL